MGGLKQAKLWQMICYCICGFRLNVEKTPGITGKRFLELFNLFVRSMGIHGKLPYLYPLYGAADITQVFSRIGAVYGGHFVLDKEMKVGQITIGATEENEEGQIKSEKWGEIDEQNMENKLEPVEQTNLETTPKEPQKSETEKEVEETKETKKKVTLPNKLILTKGTEQMEIGFEKLICGPEYNQTMMELTGHKRTVISECVMQTIHAVLKCEISIESEKVPVMMIYPEGNRVLQNRNMIRANVLSWNTKSTPLEFVYLNISFEKWEGADLDLIREEIVKDAQKKVDRKLSPKFHFTNERVYR